MEGKEGIEEEKWESDAPSSEVSLREGTRVLCVGRGGGFIPERCGLINGSEALVFIIASHQP